MKKTWVVTCSSPVSSVLVSLGTWPAWVVYLQNATFYASLRTQERNFWFKNISFLCAKRPGTRKITLSRCSWGVSSPETYFVCQNAGKKLTPWLFWGGMFFLYMKLTRFGNKDLFGTVYSARVLHSQTSEKGIFFQYFFGHSLAGYWVLWSWNGVNPTHV